MTLIEVLAGLVVLGTVLASVTIARGRFMHQTAQARQQLAAARAVDEMLSTWLGGPPGTVPVPARGTLEGTERLHWRTTWRPDRSAQNLGARVARLEVMDAAKPSNPVISIEFVIRDTRETATPATKPTEAP